LDSDIRLHQKMLEGGAHGNEVPNSLRFPGQKDRDLEI